MQATNPSIIDAQFVADMSDEELLERGAHPRIVEIRRALTTDDPILSRLYRHTLASVNRHIARRLAEKE